MGLANDTRIFDSVQWNIGENETTFGSFIWRKSPSTASWERGLLTRP